MKDLEQAKKDVITNAEQAMKNQLMAESLLFETGTDKHYQEIVLRQQSDVMRAYTERYGEGVDPRTIEEAMKAHAISKGFPNHQEMFTDYLENLNKLVNHMEELARKEGFASFTEMVNHKATTAFETQKTTVK